MRALRLFLLLLSGGVAVVEAVAAAAAAGCGAGAVSGDVWVACCGAVRAGAERCLLAKNAGPAGGGGAYRVPRAAKYAPS